MLTADAVESSDVLITMGCGDTCPVFPGKRYRDWKLNERAGQGVDAVRPIRDAIERQRGESTMAAPRISVHAVGRRPSPVATA